MALDIQFTKQLKDFKLNFKLKSYNDKISILGVSGAGKSMALKCIAGLETPDSGKIILNDKTLFDSDKKINVSCQKRKIGYLFQSYALFPHLNVYDNIAIVYPNKKQNNIDELIKLFQLEGLENQYPKDISGGQKQRVALARMFAYKPDVLLLDEPFSALDITLKNQLLTQLNKYLTEFDGDVIVVTHDYNEAFFLCDKTLVINDGQCLCDTTLNNEIYYNPKKIDIATMLGCQCLSPVQIINNNTLKAIDWNIEITTNQDIPKNTTHIGLYNQSLSFEDKLVDNCFKVTINSIIDNIKDYYINLSFNKSNQQINLIYPKKMYTQLNEKIIKINTDEILYFNESEDLE